MPLEPALANLIFISVYHLSALSVVLVHWLSLPLDTFRNDLRLVAVEYVLRRCHIVQCPGLLLECGGKRRPGSFLVWDYEIGTLVQPAVATMNSIRKYSSMPHLQESSFFCRYQEKSMDLGCEVEFAATPTIEIIQLSSSKQSLSLFIKTQAALRVRSAESCYRLYLREELSALSPVAPYIADLPSFHKVEHILTERYEDTTPLEDYVKLVDADILWVVTGLSWSRCSMVAYYACSARTYRMRHFIRDLLFLKELSIDLEKSPGQDVLRALAALLDMPADEMPSVRIRCSKLLNCALRKDSPRSPEEQASKVKLARNVSFARMYRHPLTDLENGVLEEQAAVEIWGPPPTEDLPDKMHGYHLQVICAYRSGTGSFVSAHKNFVKHVATEHYEDMTPLDDYAKFINADTFWADVRCSPSYGWAMTKEEADMDVRGHNFFT
ncbi:hypothetical protein EDD85DRAFT_932823 [Armillaria nabsnona]|nr:hypothetical protein EDD85DRAFT_932823 [Armillaria nabsnona]